ncbi:MAG: 50S ribosomal protein L21 [Coxiellaceae bacterium]|jgi:large subunit ribosomal protein L21|nr:50S ribosomal protein L21 [Coxiellaceae bacterium]
MYAIIVAGGKQYKVTPGEILHVEKLEADVGSSIEFDQVLMVTDGENIQIGIPYISGARVIGEVSEQGRGDKINIIKFRRRKHYMRRQGHRQYFTAIKVQEIKI